MFVSNLTKALDYQSRPRARGGGPGLCVNPDRR